MRTKQGLVKHFVSSLQQVFMKARLCFDMNIQVFKSRYLEILDMPQDILTLDKNIWMSQSKFLNI